ncbi:tyrosine recombinase XerC [Streptomyces sp. NPDC090085]|uniref:tyrosine recombinase XerC n=1 Tax=Streptomyces sp. NPDC090085 TaxID=3365943 RepID=UPI00382EFDDD
MLTAAARLCPSCTDIRNHARAGRGGCREDTCRRCGWPSALGPGGTCSPCLRAVRLGEDEVWLQAEAAGETLPAGRPRQLALCLAGIVLPRVHPLRKTAGPKGRIRLLAREATAKDPELLAAPAEGQPQLFATPPRTLLLTHAARIADRDIPDLPVVLAVLDEIALERGVGDSWRRICRALATLALAAREPGERLVRPENLADLPEMPFVMAQALERAGLLGRRRPRIVPAAFLTRGSCDTCLAWANDRWKTCVSCAEWREQRPGTAPCHRCSRTLPLKRDLCRFCTLVLAENSLDLHGEALDGGDQLWFGGPLAPKLLQHRALPGPRPTRKGRYFDRRKIKAAAQAARDLSPHLVDPAQQALFEAPARDWSRLDETNPPAMTEQAAALVAGFYPYTEERGWKRDDVHSTQRVLRIVVTHLGIAAPIKDADIRALARLSSNHQGVRAIDYLRRQGLLEEADAIDSDHAASRALAARLPDPFAGSVNTWIDVLTGKAAKPSLPITSSSTRRYVKDAVPVLEHWAAAGITDLREITTDHIDTVLADTRHLPTKRARHVALRSLFRALRRERQIFRDPARGVRLPVSPRLPTPVPTDRLTGILDRVPDTRGRLMIALIAVHALSVTELRRLTVRGLDRATGRLRVIWPGRPDHIVFINDITLELATAWIAERHRRWPRTSNPHLFVNRVTAASDKNSPITKASIQVTCRKAGVHASDLREDRILDEAHENADPVLLMQLFGLSQTTAVKYVATAHPADIRPDPIAP